MRATDRKTYRGKERTAYDNTHPYAVDAGADDIHDLPKRFHGSTYCRKPRCVSMMFAIGRSNYTVVDRLLRRRCQLIAEAQSFPTRPEVAFHRALILRERHRRSRDVRCD